MRILIAEDDEALAKFVRQGLESEHYSVDVFEDGEQARTAATESEYDLVVLDLNLPKMDGVSVLRHLRVKKPSVPVLVLTQRTKVEDRVQCLDSGADDYLGKPFSFSELSARIRALIRRSHLPSESVLIVGDLKLDRVQHLVERAGLRIELTAKEFALLEYLMRHAGRQVTRSMIIENVWNLTFDTTTNVVDVYIFGRWQKVESLKSAIVGLGIQRVSDIAMSCGVLNMMPGQTGGIDPVVFWEHSLGCALVCRNFARKISYLDPGKAYLAGLLHDIGVIVNLWVLPKEFRAAFEHEGIAQFVEPKNLGSDGRQLSRLFKAQQNIPLNVLEGSFLQFTGAQAYVAYAESLAAVSYINDSYGMNLRLLLANVLPLYLHN